MFNEKSDVWSFGIVVWEMLSYGELPYKMVPINQMNSFLEKVRKLRHRFGPLLPHFSAPAQPARAV